MAKERYITRIDQEREGAGSTHGWYVRVFQRTRNPISKLFSDRIHGGKNKALAAARGFRDELIEIDCPCDRLPRKHTFGDHHPTTTFTSRKTAPARPAKKAAAKKSVAKKSAAKKAPAKKAAPRKRAAGKKSARR